MKPWEETWEDDVVEIAAHVAYTPERRRLASAAPDMARVLLALIDPERLDEEGRRAGCPTCGVDTGFETCTADCALTAALRKAGVR